MEQRREGTQCFASFMFHVDLSQNPRDAFQKVKTTFKKM